MATQKSLAYHFPLQVSKAFDLVATSTEGERVAELAARYGDRLQNMDVIAAKIHMQEAVESGDWLAMAAISMAMANL